MAEQTRRERAQETGQRVYDVAFRALAATVVLVVFAGLAYLVNEGQVGDGALLLYAGVILGYTLSVAWRRR